MTIPAARSPAAPVAPTVGEALTLRCLDIWGGNEPTRNCISVPGLDITVLAEPHAGDGQGGDLYHVSLCGSGRISRFVLADVAGHGMGVSQISTRLRKLLRRHINTANQSRFARQVNAEFEQISSDGRFATALLMTYFAPTDHLIVCNAGHPRPLRYHAASGRWSLLSYQSEDAITCSTDEIGIRNLPLGVLDPSDFHQFAIPLERGDIVLGYTDALIESPDASGAPIGEGGLCELVSRLPGPDPERIAAALMDRVKELRRGEPLGDDATLLALHHNAGKPENQSLAERMRVWRKLIGL